MIIISITSVFWHSWVQRECIIGDGQHVYCHSFIVSLSGVNGGNLAVYLCLL